LSTCSVAENKGGNSPKADCSLCSFSNKIVIAVRNNPKDYPLRCNYLFFKFFPQ